MKKYRGNAAHENAVRIHLKWFMKSLLNNKRHDYMSMVFLKIYREEVWAEKMRLKLKKERKMKG